MLWNIFKKPLPSNNKKDYKKKVANYEKERQTLQALLEPECQERIVLIRGISGQGKSLLLRDFNFKAQSQSLPVCKIDFKNATISVENIFSSLGNELVKKEWRKLHHLNRAVFAILHPNDNPGIGITASWLVDINAHLTKTLTKDRSLREQRREQLTLELVKDIITVQPKIFLIWLDTFEKANDEIVKWVNHFLGLVPDCSPVRIVIGGQNKLPDHDNGVWGDCCSYHELNGVPNPDEWVRIGEAAGKKLSEEDIAILRDVCERTKGHCSSMDTFIDGLGNEQTHG